MSLSLEKLTQLYESEAAKRSEGRNTEQVKDDEERARRVAAAIISVEESITLSDAYKDAKSQLPTEEFLDLCGGFYELWEDLKCGSGWSRNV